MKPLRRAVVTGPLFGVFKRVLPQMSQTEQEALDAGSVWWDADLFSGRPDWKKLLAYPAAKLTAEEQAFMDGPVEELCGMLDEWDINHERMDLPPEAWKFIRDKGFLGIIIPKSYGGLGFSAFAHSEIVTKISTRSGAAAVTVMVPNSLGPAELLMHYGTEAQKNHYLPRLARGQEIPCFALTNPDAGSDAASIPDFGIVCKGLHEGRESLGIRLTWEKRYITLAPVATLLGLAFKLHDPDRLLGGEEDIGITLALVPDRAPGREHRPPPQPAGLRVHERPDDRQGRLHPPRLGDRRGRAGRHGLAHAHGVPGRRPLDLAAVDVDGRGQARHAHDRRLRAHPLAVQDAHRPVRGHRGGRSRASAARPTSWTPCAA